MKMISIEKELKENSYPGRGIIVGRSEDGTKAVIAYFIMGRSSNSRNRIFVEDGEGIRTQAFDPSKLEDPSLIIYAPVRVLGNKTIVTNGDQTDTIYDGMDKQLTFEQSLRSREFESNNGNPESCNSVIHLPIIKFQREKAILFLHICMMAIHYQVLKVSQSGWQFRMIWMHLLSCFGAA